MMFSIASPSFFSFFRSFHAVGMLLASLKKEVFLHPEKPDQQHRLQQMERSIKDSQLLQ